MNLPCWRFRRRFPSIGGRIILERPTRWSGVVARSTVHSISHMSSRFPLIFESRFVEDEIGDVFRLLSDYCSESVNEQRVDEGLD